MKDGYILANPALKEAFAEVMIKRFVCDRVNHTTSIITTWEQIGICPN